MAAAGAPPLPPSDNDEPDYGLLPPKALEKLFGVDTILRNPDDPTDGLFEVIKDKKGVVLFLRNPRSGRWLRYDKGTAQRLVDEAQNAVVQDVPTLLPVRIEPRPSTRKRKRDDDVEQGDVGEPAQAVVKKTAVDRVQQKKNAKKKWRVAGTAVRFSLRTRQQQATTHTGLSLDFERMDV
jgi:hypothetical protein